MSEEIEVDTDVSQLVGRTIVAADRQPPSKEDWPLYDESLTLTLDDGSLWRFDGEGYDASSLRIYVTKPSASGP